MVDWAQNTHLLPAFRCNTIRSKTLTKNFCTVKLSQYKLYIYLTPFLFTITKSLYCKSNNIFDLYFHTNVIFFIHSFIYVTIYVTIFFNTNNTLLQHNKRHKRKYVTLTQLYTFSSTTELSKPQ